jgi:hypothetical protein
MPAKSEPCQKRTEERSQSNDPRTARAAIEAERHAQVRSENGWMAEWIDLLSKV